MRTLALLVLLALSGCLRVGPGEDLHLVCERESTSPWHPYPPHDLAQIVRTDGPVDAAVLRAITRDVADRIVTPGGAPYAPFEARLVQEAEGRWRFLANGSWPDGVDHYDIGWPLARDEPVPATAWLRQQAAGAVADHSALAARVGEEPRTAEWRRELPGCVRLEYEQDVVWVNVDKRLVVSVEPAVTARDEASGRAISPAATMLGETTK